MGRAGYLGLEVLNHRLVRELGEGGFGCVYLAEQIELGRLAACKILHPEFAHQPEAVERFIREAKAACAVGHRTIVEIENFGWLPTGEPFYLMEYFPGQSLDDYLQSRGAVPMSQITALFQPVASALGAAHARGVVHRDLKPANIMLREEHGRIVEVKLLDFGIAKLMDDSAASSTSTGLGLGTPKFMAPEQARDAKHVDQRADVYGFAATLFAALTGRPPFAQEQLVDVVIAVQMQPPPPLRQLLPSAPAELEQMIARCLAKRPEERPRTIEEAWAGIARAMSPPPNGVEPMPLSHTGPTVIDPRAPTLVRAEPAAIRVIEQTTMGSASSELLTLARPRRAHWQWIGAGIGLVGAGILGAFVLVGLSEHQEPQAPVTITAGPREQPQGGAAGMAETIETAAEAAEVAELAAAPSQGLADAALADADMDMLDANLANAVHASPPDAGEMEFPPAVVDVPDTRTEPDEGTRRSAPALECSRASFQRVYQAPAPQKQAAREALARLKKCRKDGGIGSKAYRELQDALVKVLLGKR